MVKKVESLYDEFSILIEDLQLQSDLVDMALSQLAENSAKKKHLVQQSSIVGHLLNLDKDTVLPNSGNREEVLVEFGAGRAQLSYWLMKLKPSLRCVLVDRSGVRYVKSNLICNPV